MTTATKIRILSDTVEENDPSGPVPVGTVVEAYLPSLSDYVMEPGEAWFVRPDTNEEWLALPGDYEVIYD
jgi:hypothetical protein